MNLSKRQQRQFFQRKGTVCKQIRQPLYSCTHTLTTTQYPHLGVIKLKKKSYFVDRISFEILSRKFFSSFFFLNSILFIVLINNILIQEKTWIYLIYTIYNILSR